MAFGMSANGLQLNEIPSDTKIGFSDNGAIRANYPDGSSREFIANDSGGGEMITTLSDGTTVESILSFEDGVISVTSTSSAGEQTVMTIDEDGVNFQSISADGTVDDQIPADMEALIASWVTATEDLASAIFISLEISMLKVHSFGMQECLRIPSMIPLKRKLSQRWNLRLKSLKSLKSLKKMRVLTR